MCSRHHPLDIPWYTMVIHGVSWQGHLSPRHGVLESSRHNPKLWLQPFLIVATTHDGGLLEARAFLWSLGSRFREFLGDGLCEFHGICVITIAQDRWSVDDLTNLRWPKRCDVIAMSCTTFHAIDILSISCVCFNHCTEHPTQSWKVTSRQTGTM